MNQSSNSIGIIGVGNLGQSLAKGLVQFGQYTSAEIGLFRRSKEKLSDLAAQGYQVYDTVEDLVKSSSTLFLAVLPQQLNTVLDQIKPHVHPEQLVISLVTGVKIEVISERLNQHPLVARAMPNTAISIGESMTCISTNEASKKKENQLLELFNQVGSTIVIKEEQMTSATALCACGTAFFLRAIRAAMQGGTEIDFHAEESLLMAAQTAKGAAMLLLQNHSHPEEEIDKVTSPKGCTIAGLNNMEHSGFSSAFIKGITTSAQQAKELYQ